MTQYISKNTYDAIQWLGNNQKEFVNFFNDPYYGHVAIKTISFEQIGDVLVIKFSNMNKTHLLYIDSWFVICKNTACIEILDNKDFCNSYQEIGGAQ